MSMPPKIPVFSLLVAILAFMTECNSPTKSSTASNIAPIKVVRDTSWERFNILLPDGATPDDLKKAQNLLKGDVDAYLANHNRIAGSDFTDTIVYTHCPCDPGLINANVVLLAGSGTTYPPPAKGPGGSGDKGYSVDFLMAVDTSHETVASDFVPAHMTFAGNSMIHMNKKLAIIDTGLDTSLFVKKPGGWIFNAGNSRVWNTLPGKDEADWRDDHKEKHGSAVAALAMMGAHTRLPQLIIIKALDSLKMGSSYTVGCAVSCAINDGASAINASLGYYDSKSDNDPVLLRAMSKCDKAQIPVFAAAGNVMIGKGKLPGSCDARTDAANQLSDHKLFFPACYGDKLPYVLSVTGLNDTLKSCANQNISDKYVKVGLINLNSCCAYQTEINRAEYTGTSFATPLVAGIVMNAAIKNPTADMLSLFNQLLNHSTYNKHTKDGAYLNFPHPDR